MNCHPRTPLLLAAVPLLAFAWYAAQEFPADFYEGIPLSERSTAMGASDPSWSPDGARIAFSLFGSIWWVPANGGEATQITASSSYDAGAAWSPSGNSIAFLRGPRPIGGVQLGTQGKLTLVDVATGTERTLAPDFDFIGTPAWSTDGRSLFANRIQGPEPVLFHIPLDGAAPRRLTGPLSSRVPTIVPRGTGWFYFWYPVAPHPGGLDIAFAGDRDNTPQIWRMPLHDGLVLTAKLTRYAEKDQADIQDLAWAGPDSLLYSANLHSQRTNFDLWRWRSGGAAERLTSTIHDEFSPRPSPDGKTILFVSNFLGNLDLFTTTPDIRRARHLPIGPLRFRQPAATVRVRLRDDAGKPIAARVSFRAGDRKYYTPPGALYRFNPGMGESAGFFHTTDFNLSAPAGDFRIAAFHGIEFEPAVRTLSIEPNHTTEVELVLKRRSSWQGHGWWSGEDHIHANYAGPYYLRPQDALDMIEAEDLNVANMLAANAEGARVYDREFFEGKPNALSTPTRILYWNEEYRNRIVYGHMALLNLRELIPPVYTSFEGTPHPWDYPSNTMVARDAKARNAVVDYVHPIVGLTRDPFDFTVSAKELPVTAALGYVDIIDIYPWGPIALDVWYNLLNCGFRIAPGAGTDTFSNWRSINQIPGSHRVFVRSSEPLSYAGWIDGLREGRSFASNGPLLDLEVNGKRPGEILRSDPGQPLTLTAKARAESRVPLTKLELLLNGTVVAATNSPGAQELTLAWNQPLERSGWIALKASGISDPLTLGAPAQAHTAAVYLEKDGRKMTPDPAAAAMFLAWIDRLSDLIEKRNNFQAPQHKEEVRKLLRQARAFYQRAVSR